MSFRNSETVFETSRMKFFTGINFKPNIAPFFMVSLLSETIFRMIRTTRDNFLSPKNVARQYSTIRTLHNLFRKIENSFLFALFIFGLSSSREVGRILNRFKFIIISYLMKRKHSARACSRLQRLRYKITHTIVYTIFEAFQHGN